MKSLVNKLQKLIPYREFKTNSKGNIIVKDINNSIIEINTLDENLIRKITLALNQNNKVLIEDLLNINKENTAQNYFEEIEKYNKYLIKLLNIRKLGDDFIPIENLYVPIFLSDNQQNIISQKKILENYSKVIITGKPGSGKSTLLKYLIFEIINGSSNLKQTPVYISLSYYHDKEFDIFKHLKKTFRESGINGSDNVVTSFLENNNLLFLIDGLDEISRHKRRDIIYSINSLSQNLKDYSIIVTCRKGVYIEPISGFFEYEILDFKEDQIIEFATKWLDKGSIKNKNTIISTKSLTELFSTPLSASLICASLKNYTDFSNIKKIDLYNNYFNTIFTDWDRIRLVKRDKIYKELSQKGKKLLYQYISYSAMIKNSYNISTRDVLQYVRDFFRNNNYEVNNLEFDDEGILEAMEIQHGLFSTIGDKFSFSHLSFQEYFTAEYIKNNFSSIGLSHISSQDFQNGRWQNVFVLLTGMWKYQQNIIFINSLKTKGIDLLQNNPNLRNNVWKSKESNSLQSDSELQDTINRFYNSLLSLNDESEFDVRKRIQIWVINASLNYSYSSASAYYSYELKGHYRNWSAMHSENDYRFYLSILEVLKRVCKNVGYYDIVFFEQELNDKIFYNRFLPNFNSATHDIGLTQETIADIKRTTGIEIPSDLLKYTGGFFHHNTGEQRRKEFISYLSIYNLILMCNYENEFLSHQELQKCFIDFLK